MTGKDAQLATLADALTKIVEVATIGPATTTPIVELLARTGDLATEALVVAATHGPLPPPAPLLASAETPRAADGS